MTNKNRISKKNAFRLAYLNLKKRKGTVVFLTIMILLAVTTFDFGLSTLLNMDTAYYEKAERLNTPHIISTMSYTSVNADIVDFYEHDDRIKEYEKVIAAVANFPDCNIDIGQKRCLFLDYDHQPEMKKCTIVGGTYSADSENAIFVPLAYKSTGIDLGDNLIFTYGGTEYAFIVAGFYETCFNSNIMGVESTLFVHSSKYDSLCTNLGRMVIMHGRLDTSGGQKYVFETARQICNTLQEIDKESAKSEGTDILHTSIDSQGNNATMVNRMISIVMMILALIICIVTAVIIHNRIREAITESVCEIGILKAMGYPTKVISASYVIEFLFPGLISAVLGIIFSYVIVPLTDQLMCISSGYLSIQKVHFTEDLITMLLVTFLIGITIVLSVKRISRFTIVDSITGKRMGDARASRIHLYSKHIPTNLLGSLQDVSAKKRQCVTFIITVTLCSFLMGALVLIYYNFAGNKNCFRHMYGQELSELLVYSADGTDVYALEKEIMKYPGVLKTNLTPVSGMSVPMGIVDGNDVAIWVTRDFNYDTTVLIEGTFPQSEDEVTLSPNALKGKYNVGDSVTIEMNGIYAQYTISGFTMSMIDKNTYMTFEGMKRIDPDVEYVSIMVYLDGTVDANELSEKFKADFSAKSDLTEGEEKLRRLLADYGIHDASFSVYKDGVEIYRGGTSDLRIQDVIGYSAAFDSIMKSIATALGAFAGVFIAVSVLIIVGMMMTEIKNDLRKNSKDFGIYRAMGMTVKEISLRISLRYLLTTVTGTILGTLLSLVAFKMILEKSYMLGDSFFDIFGLFPRQVIAVNAVSCVFIFLVSVLRARRVRKISPYELMTE